MHRLPYLRGCLPDRLHQDGHGRSLTATDPKMGKIRRIVIGGISLVAAGFFAATLAPAADVSRAQSRGSGPTVKIHRGEKCVEPTEDMRRNHMSSVGSTHFSPR